MNDVIFKKRILTVLLIAQLLTGCSPGAPSDEAQNSPDTKPSESISTNPSITDTVPGETANTEPNTPDTAAEANITQKPNTEGIAPGEPGSANPESDSTLEINWEEIPFVVPPKYDDIGPFTEGWQQ